MLVKKCGKQYPEHCLLVVHINPDLTDANEMNALIDQIKVPAEYPFSEIYLAGLFPSSSGGSSRGYYCWKLASSLSNLS